MIAALLPFNFEQWPGAKPQPISVRNSKPVCRLSFDGRGQQSISTRLPRLVAVVGLHVALLAWIAGAQVSAPPESLPIRMAVRSIEAPPPPQIRPPVTDLPKPLPQVARAPVRRPQTAAPQAVMATAPGAELPPAAFSVAPQPSSASTDTVAFSSPAPAPVTSPVTAARFDADYLQNPAPAYPAMSRRLGEEGKVLLDVKVTAAGEPVQVQLKQSSGFARLDDAAIHTVEHWRFTPAHRGSEAVTAHVVVPIVFRLNI